jgi:hypothetical protein
VVKLLFKAVLAKGAKNIAAGYVVTTLSVRGLCVSLCSWHTYCVRNCLPEHVLGRSAA